ncbi:MAG TPA: DUF5777 family beta-barrel protein [Vicinamibacterales bacterium]|nr:DUF5777 family beta-barrel protein [Vicinamibacterales bacterium]
MMSWSIRSTLRLSAVMLFLVSGPAFAQDPASPASTPAPAPAPDQDVPVAAPRPTQIDLNLINLPTTLSLVRHHSYFRLTHRFASDLRRGDFGDQAADLFSLDKGAIIGLEYRFGITSNIQAGIHRSMLSKTIQMFGRWDALRQSESMPVALSLTLSTEGLNNYHKNYQHAVAMTASRTFGDRLALYTTPAFVSGTHAVDFLAGHDEHEDDLGLDEDEHAGHDDTWFMGFGARLRFAGTGYLTGEYTPRLHGYDPNGATWGVAIEKRTGGHTLQLNFTNSFGTTFGQLARGGNPHDIYLGFNITRRF